MQGDILTLGIDGVNEIWRDAKVKAVGKARVKIIIEASKLPKNSEACQIGIGRKHKGETRISRRGWKILGYFLFEAAMSLVAKNPEFRELHVYYINRRLNSLKEMQPLMAVASKLLQVFTLC